MQDCQCSGEDLRDRVDRVVKGRGEERQKNTREGVKERGSRDMCGGDGREMVSKSACLRWRRNVAHGMMSRSEKKKERGKKVPGEGLHVSVCLLISA